MQQQIKQEQRVLTAGKKKSYRGKPGTRPGLILPESRSCDRTAPAEEKGGETSRARPPTAPGPVFTHLQDGDLGEVFLLEVGVCDQLQLCLKETIKRLQTEEARHPQTRTLVPEGRTSPLAMMTLLF